MKKFYAVNKNKKFKVKVLSKGGTFSIGAI